MSESDARSEAGANGSASTATHSERMLRAAVYGSPIPQFVIDREHRVVHWNRALELLSGVTASEVVGTDRHWSAFYPAERPCLADLLVDGATDQIPSLYERWTASGILPDAYEATGFLPALGPDGTWLESLAKPIRDEDGIVVGAVETLQDVTERTHAGQFLRESEERYRAIFDAANDAIFIHDADSGLVLDCNHRSEELYGYTAEEFRRLGVDQCSALAPPYTAEAAFLRLRKAVTEGPQVFEWPARNRAGDPFWVEVSLRRAQIGPNSRIVAVVRDNRERRKAEEDLRLAQEEMARILNSSSEIIAHLAPDLRILWANRTASVSARASQQEMQGHYCYEFYHQRPEPCVDCPVIRARQTGEAQQGELTGADGRTWFVRGYPVTDNEGRLIGLSEFRLDVTERRRAEEAQRASEERYRRITEATTDYIYTVRFEDGELVATHHGAGCVAVTGYAPEEFHADPGLWIKMVVEEDRPIVLAASARIRSSGDPGSVEHRIVRKDGQVRWVKSTTSLHRDKEGRLLAYDGLVQDITEQKRLQAQLLQSQKMEAIGRLAGGVAHDFNNLLTAIIGFAQLLRRRTQDDETARGYLEHIERAGERAADLTKQLLAFARKQVVAPRLVDLNAVVEEATRVLVPLLTEAIDVRTSLAEGVWRIKADPGQIQQVILNMAVNARDAMPRGGTLTIETLNRTLDAASATAHGGVEPGPYVVLAISDTGAGMSQEVLNHLFEPFYTTKPRGQGTGLGLATCHGIVQQCGGHIRVFSELGCGTSFRILLPKAAGAETGDVEPADAGDVEPADAGEVVGGTETILLVEDETAVRSLAARALRSLGYTVYEAPNGPSAIALAMEHSREIELLLTDVIMPGMNGREVADRLRDLGTHAKVLFVSGHAQSAVAHHGVLDPGIAFLPKPFGPDNLARKVREVLDSH